MCINFDGHHSGGSSFVNVNDFFVITEIVCIPTGTSLALSKNRSMRVPIYSLVLRTWFGSAIRVGLGSGCDRKKMCRLSKPVYYHPHYLMPLQCPWQVSHKIHRDML